MGKRKEQVPGRVLKPLRSVDIHQLRWEQAGWAEREFELTSGDDLVGHLYWPKWLSDHAVAECGDGRWIIDRLGFFRDHGAAIEVGSEAEIAQFQFDWLGDSQLTLANGRRYELYRTKILSETWELADAQGDVVMVFHGGMHWFKYLSDIELEVGAIQLPELPLLILLCWYLIYMRIQAAAAAAAAASAAS
jgi:hypothetical protein